MSKVPVESLIPLAARLIVLVHGEGGRSDIGEFLAGLSDDERWALLVVLAAMVNPDRSLGAALGWVAWDERGDPGALGLADTRTIRDVAPDVEAEPSCGELIDSEVLRRALVGEFVDASDSEKRAVIEAAVREGVEPVVVSRGLGLGLKCVQKQIERARVRLTNGGTGCENAGVQGVAS
ncbi:hypothetical protein B4N89_27415 [Embleya scabrispora]|uniref:Uncharacterized protein n=2 Tax=Embleya scabrispora TaxID=159449 RepID=A0A1T3P4Y6_9ACTN|nr:hypothetical protein B4N89_27415 [Embleya scabrispora]